MIRGLSAALLIAAGQGAAGQTRDSIPLSGVRPGAEIRVWAHEPPVSKWRFVYLGSSTDAISVAEMRGSATIRDFSSTIQIADVHRLETNVGRRASGAHFAKSTMLGAVVGTFVGIAVGMCVDEGLRNPANDDPLPLLLFGGVGLGAGSLAGAVAGAQGAPVWAPVALPRER
jgi:hypothetical protein